MTGRKFRAIDNDGNGTVSRQELQLLVQQLRIKLSEEDIDRVIEKFDKNGNGTIDYDEFLRGMRPSMSNRRKDYINKAFRKMDKTGDKVITVADLKDTYCVRYHPKYQNGEYTEDKVFQEFLNSFQVSDDKDEKVTEEEFMDYFIGVSASIDTDAYFQLMMEQAWKI